MHKLIRFLNFVKNSRKNFVKKGSFLPFLAVVIAFVGYQVTALDQSPVGPESPATTASDCAVGCGFIFPFQADSYKQLAVSFLFI